MNRATCFLTHRIYTNTYYIQYILVLEDYIFQKLHARYSIRTLRCMSSVTLVQPTQRVKCFRYILHHIGSNLLIVNVFAMYLCR